MWQALVGSLVGQGADVGTQFATKAYDQYLWKKNLRDYAKLQYSYAQKYSENGPSWNVKGLRDAGLNPILAVSNGVNLGANVPNFSSSSPSGTVKSNFGGTVDAALSRKIEQQNADTNEQNAESNALNAQAAMIQAEAAMSRAHSQNQVDMADVNLKKIDAERRGGSKYDHPISRDFDKIIKGMQQSVKDLWDAYGYSESTVRSYLQHAPMKPKETNTQYQKRLRGYKDDDEERYWKTRRTWDGSPVYRRTGDIGGHMPIYR